jgi:hypothetical protein
MPASKRGEDPGRRMSRVDLDTGAFAHWKTKAVISSLEMLSRRGKKVREGARAVGLADEAEAVKPAGVVFPVRDAIPTRWLPKKIEKDPKLPICPAAARSRQSRPATVESRRAASAPDRLSH